RDIHLGHRDRLRLVTLGIHRRAQNDWRVVVQLLFEINYPAKVFVIVIDVRSIKRISTCVEWILRQNAVLGVDEDAVIGIELELQSRGSTIAELFDHFNRQNVTAASRQANFIVLRGGVVTSERQSADKKRRGYVFM